MHGVGTVVVISALVVLLAAPAVLAQSEPVQQSPDAEIDDTSQLDCDGLDDPDDWPDGDLDELLACLFDLPDPADTDEPPAEEQGVKLGARPRSAATSASSTLRRRSSVEASLRSLRREPSSCS